LLTPCATIGLVGEKENSQAVAMEAARFTIGQGADNDLAIDELGLARRHAQIESFDGVFQLSDCGSSTGTFVNGNAIKGTVVLRDGDEIRLGFAILAFHLEPGSGQTEAQEHRSQRIDLAQTGFVMGLSTPILAVTVSIAAVVIALLIIALSKNHKSSARVAAYDLSNRAEQIRATDRSETQSDAEDLSKIETPTKAPSIELIEQSLVGFLRRISTDERAYIFPPDAVPALDDIRRRVEEYRGSPGLVAAFNTINISGSIAAEARREGVEPTLVIFTALTLSDGGRAGNDQISLARLVMSDLVSLRKTLGTESADKSLILIAAYRMGGGTKRSHPLIRTMTRVIKNPLTDRNVWYLREQGALDDQTYDFVVRFLALGAIAENPAKFGVNAPRIGF
jgi:FHA domain